MGYKMNIRGEYSWNNLLKDTNVEITDNNDYFTSTTLEGVLDELFNLVNSSAFTWNSVITNTNAVAGNGYFVNTSGGTITITLPSSASLGDTIKVSDINGSFATNNCTIARNGLKIMGLEENFICDINNLTIELVYSNATNGWRITNFSY